MKALENKILAEGEVFPGNVLKVSSFLNQRIDVDFLMEMGKEIARLFEDTKIDKIMTVEASGIAVAVAAAAYIHVPVVFAKKSKTANMDNDCYSSLVHSYTHGTDNTIIISKKYVSENENILIVDDFLALGNAVFGMMEIVKNAGANTVGVASAIEKGFQKGGDKLRAQGVRVESLAIIDEMTDTAIKFRPQS